MEIVRKNGVSLASVAHPGRFGRHLLLTILALFFIPYLASAALLFSPIYLITAILSKKLDDPAFRNSVQFTVKLILWPIIFLIYAVVAFITMPWFSALVSLLLIAPAYMILHDVVRLVRLLISDIRLRMIAKNLPVNPLNKK
ncbi:MAG: hypothetical protein HUJ90_01545 [Bacteroidales bacterium]|nr:hypothetical protein [Bacteroidales bacterium]